MVLELIYGMINHHIRGNGKTMFLMVMVNMYGVMAKNIKDISRTISLMDLVDLSTLMEVFSQVNLKIVKNMVLAF